MIVLSLVLSLLMQWLIVNSKITGADNIKK